MISPEKEIDKYLQRMFYINRSITGDGNRETLKILQEIIPIKVKEYSTGDQVYDWVIPKEWNISDAWIKNSSGEKIISFKNSNLHVVSYSTPVQRKIKFRELKKHLHYIEDLPNAIPYRTSYYHETWGFCVSFEQYQELFNKDDDEEYEVCINSKLHNGSLSVGELILPGKSEKEILISCYICHPSMANDSLSGVILTAFLAKQLMEKELNFTYRIIFVPETIGAISYCAKNELRMKHISYGLVITTVGGPGKFGYKQSWDKECCINSLVEDVFLDENIEYKKYLFDIHGSDERQYSSQGFRINCITITKDKYYEYDYYHTSLDNLKFVQAKYIRQSLNLYSHLINKLEKNLTFKNRMPHCEVMLSKHDLYPKTGGGINQLNINAEKSKMDIILELLFYCDGESDLHQISKSINIDMEILYDFAIELKDKFILEVVA